MTTTPFARTRLETIVAQLEQDAKSKIDFITDTRTLRIAPSTTQGAHSLLLVPDDAQTREWLPKDGIPILPQAITQLCEKSDPSIPTRFLQDLTTAGQSDLACTNLNTLLRTKPKRVLVRCLRNVVRGILSDRFKVMDYMDFLPITLAKARQFGAEVAEASYTDTHMRIKLVRRDLWDAVNASQRDGTHQWFRGTGGNPQMQDRLNTNHNGDAPLPGGKDTIHPALTISNSETGHGGVNISYGILEAWCNNLAMIEKALMKIHIGTKLDEGIFSRTTMALQDKATIAQIQDAIAAGFEEPNFKRLVTRIKGATLIPISAPAPAVDNVITALDLPQSQRDSILSYFCKDYGQNVYGLAQALSRTAQDTDDPDLAETFETASGKLMLNPSLATA